MHRTFRIATALIVLGTTGACAAIQPNLSASDDRLLWRRVHTIGNHVIAATRATYGDDNIAWRVGVLEGDPIGAGALFDGSIGVLADFARDLKNDELAAVIAHEISHVLHGHAPCLIVTNAGSVVATAGVATAGFIILPWWGGFLALLGLETTRELGVAAYARSNEYEADADALDIVRTAGYRDDAVVRMLAKLTPYAERHGLPSATFFDTHPTIPHRIAAIEARIAEQE